MSCPDIADAEQVRAGHGVTLGGYFFKKPQADSPPYPALILLRGFAGHAPPWPAWLRCLGQRLRRPRFVVARLVGLRRARVTRACASRSTFWRP